MLKRIITWAACLILCFAALPPAAALADSPVFKTDEVLALVAEAKEQYEKEDYTPLFPKLNYRILWLGYTHVTYGKLDFRMTKSDRQYLEAVTKNFEAYVEKTTSHSLNIEIDLFFVDDATPLTKVDGDEWLLLARETVMPKIREYDAKKQFGYDTVITTVQTDGDANVRRNQNVPGYDKHYVMLGVKTHGVESDIGYSTMNLGKPVPGTYPQKDPEIPSLYATAVAVHEWLHQLEYLGQLMGIKYPNTHLYQGGYPGYQSYEANKNNYDYFEFYELVLQGKVPYKSGGKVKHVGMYPKMWKLAKRSTLNYGTYTITNSRGEYLSFTPGSQKLTLSKKECRWTLRYDGGKRVIISPLSTPDYRIDLDNAWDEENNKVKVMGYTGYVEAQSWIITENSDGSFCIQSPIGIGRVVTVNHLGDSAVITAVKNRNKPADGQRWYFTSVK